MTTFEQILGAALVTTTLALAGCQGDAEQVDRETTEQDLSIQKDAPQRRHFDAAKMFERADKNGDGKVAEGEVKPRHWEHIKIADANGDNLLTQDELHAAHAAGKLRPPVGAKHELPSVDAMLEHLDTDKDGKLSVSELPEHVRERLSASDSDGNGVLDRVELDAHLLEMKARFAARHE